MSLTAFFFPVKQEASGLLRLMSSRNMQVIDGVTQWRGKLQGQEILVVLLGMGGDSVRRHLPLILKSHRLDFAWVAGFGGGLSPALKKGDVVLVENFSSENLSFSKEALCVKGVTVDHVIASSTQKRALAQGHQAQVVDMESEIAHRLLTDQQISHATLRGISDPWSESLPAGALNASFDPEKNRPTPFRLLFHLIIHPEDFSPFFRFVIGLSRVQKNLTLKLLTLDKTRLAEKIESPHNGLSHE